GPPGIVRIVPRLPSVPPGGIRRRANRLGPPASSRPKPGPGTAGAPTRPPRMDPRAGLSSSIRPFPATRVPDLRSPTPRHAAPERRPRKLPNPTHDPAATSIGRVRAAPPIASNPTSFGLLLRAAPKWDAPPGNAETTARKASAQVRTQMRAGGKRGSKVDSIDQEWASRRKRRTQNRR
ncbi:MAG: hypothetical protein RLZZ114_510, partial [Bacteroidota bacterium]